MSESTDSNTDIIRNYILEAYFSDDPQALANDTPLLSSGVIDSVSVMVLVEFLENEFGFEFEPHEVDTDNLDSVERISTFVASRTA